MVPREVATHDAPQVVAWPLLPRDRGTRLRLTSGGLGTRRVPETWRLAKR